MAANDPKADIAYLRDLAEAGERAPLVGGSHAVWWGGAATLVLLMHWAIITGRAPVGPEMLWPIWLGFIVIGSVGGALLGRALRDKPGQGSAANRAGAVWSVQGFMTLAVFIAITAGVALGRLEPVMFNLILPVALFGYAVGWLTQAAVARSWMIGVPGVVAALGMMVCVIVVQSAAVYLAAAVAVFASAVIPGVFMMRAGPKDTV